MFVIEETIGTLRCLLLVTPTTKVAEDLLLLYNIRRLVLDGRTVIGLLTVYTVVY